MNSPVSNTRNNLACSSSGISAISSKNKVPPAARSNTPLCSRIAPVNAPFTCPNNSLSKILAFKAAQLIAIKTCACRWLRACTACATNSLPLPDSPRTKTGNSVIATRSIMEYICCICGESLWKNSAKLFCAWADGVSVCDDTVATLGCRKNKHPVKSAVWTRIFKLW